jgi:putative oxygen-independent coproporphyrinogen III oxidase
VTAPNGSNGVGAKPLHTGDGVASSVPRGGFAAPSSAVGPAARVHHLYVHLPFCAHRCGYCDFVTVLGGRGQDGAYVDALLAELQLEHELLTEVAETIFLGGGTPTFTDPEHLARLLAGLPPTQELTVEANPETVTPALAALLREHRVNRISLGVQTFQPHLIDVLERRASPEAARTAVQTLRAAGFANVSLDLIYGIPGQSEADLRADIASALALDPEHLSCYELEAKPGTRFTHVHGDALAVQAEAMEGYFELVVSSLTSAGYRWYETANFCRTDPVRDLRARHNLGYWLGRDYLGLGVGAVSTIGGLRRRNLPSLPRYVAALRRGVRPPREHEPLDERTKARERILLGLRLDEPFATAGLEELLDDAAASRLELLDLVRRTPDRSELTLTHRGRFLGGGVTADLIA